MKQKKNDSPQHDDASVSLSPLNIKQALSGLFAIPDPEATKPNAITSNTNLH